MDPDNFDAWVKLGELLSKLDRHEEATTALREARAIRPASNLVHARLALAFCRIGRPCEAVDAAQLALRLGYDPTEGHCILAEAFLESGHADESVDVLERAVSQSPLPGKAHMLLGRALIEARRFDDALSATTKALSFCDRINEARLTHAIALHAAGRLCDAIPYYDSVLQMEPARAEAHFRRATALLRLGRYEDAWPGYEWRLKLGDFNPIRLYFRRYGRPHWRGEDAKGKTILVLPEQGSGDVFQLVRFVSTVKARGARVILRCRRTHLRILQTMDDIDDFVGPHAKDPPFDYYVSMLSLPWINGTRVDSVPARVPYLHPEPALVQLWQRRLQAHNSLCVGLAWAGNPEMKDDLFRSIELRAFAPLGSLRGVHFVGLQKGEAASQRAPRGLSIQNVGNDLGDFVDCAAVIANLDLVIAADTAVAHLAGALGKEVWTLVRWNPDWRWLADQETTPWYPTMTIFNQDTPDDWGDVLSRVATRLARVARARDTGETGRNAAV